jgi:hypothetical protein
MPLTDEMIVTGYRKRPAYSGKKVSQPQRKEHREMHRREKPQRTGISRGSDKTGQRTERKRPLPDPLKRRP